MFQVTDSGRAISCYDLVKTTTDLGVCRLTRDKGHAAFNESTKKHAYLGFGSGPPTFHPRSPLAAVPVGSSAHLLATRCQAARLA